MKRIIKEQGWKIAALAAIVLMIVAVWYSGQAAERANEGVEITEKVKGNPSAAVTVTEFGDFQCPACAAAHPVVQDLLDQYGDRIRFEYKHLPLTAAHPHALSSAVAAEAAGVQGKFFAFHDMLFENQQSWSQASAPQTFYIEYADQLGLDVPTFRRHLDSSLLEQEVMKDLSEAQSLGLRGTPSFLINGQAIQLQSYDDLFNAVEAALGEDAEASDADTITTTDTTTSDGTPDVRFSL